MLLDVKNFNLHIFASIWMARAAKSFDLDVLGSPNLQIRDFNILGPCPWMLKASIWMFLDHQTSKSKTLTSWGHAPGC